MRVSYKEDNQTTEKEHVEHVASAPPPPQFHLWAMDTVFSLLLWSQICEIWSTIWYIPMNAMKISGYELFLVFLALPSLLAFPWFRQSCRTYHQLRFASLIGLLAAVVGHQGPQILFLAIGTAVSLTYWLLDAPASRIRIAFTAPFGPVLLMSLRWACASVNPIFHFKVVAALAAAAGVWACYTYSLNCAHSPVNMFHDRANHASSAHAAMIGLFLGAVLFCYHALLTQPGVIARWVGAPMEPLGWVVLVFIALSVRGDLIFPGAAFAGLSGIFFVMSIALELPLFLRMAAGIACLVSLKQQLPRALLAFAAANRPGTIVLVGVLSYSAFGLATVWTVAYPFVPGGDLLRERTSQVRLSHYLLRFSRFNKPNLLKVFIISFLCMIVASLTGSLTTMCV
jgi:hypothetical protein